MEAEKILIVDDNAIIAYNNRKLIEKKGYEVVGTAVSGEMAIELTDEHNPDLILMDIVLQTDLDGINATEKIKENHDIPVIYCTAHSDEDTLSRAKATEPHGYLLKPIEKEDLYSTIELALYKHKMDKKLKESERKYHTLFRKMIDGYALHEIILDDTGKPDDYRFIDFNPAFENQTGLTREVIGKTVKEIMPDIDNSWIEKYGRVALGGESIRFENYATPLKKWFEVVAYSPGERQFACTFIDITDRKLAEEGLKTSMKEKDILLKEVHHRVKNNFQVIMSLFDLQFDNLNGESDTRYIDMRNRVKSMALVHEMLYQHDDFAEVDFNHFLQHIVEEIASIRYSGNDLIRTNIDVKDISLEIDKAIPCALVINELVTNSYKHAFRNNGQGEISIKMTEDDEGYITLLVKDNGTGLPKGFNYKETKTLGFNLITALVMQLEGEIEIGSGTGTSISVRFKGF